MDAFPRHPAGSEERDAWNMLGYARWAATTRRRSLPYERALALDPHHRGAHSYRGVAYVRTNDLAKAASRTRHPGWSLR